MDRFAPRSPRDTKRQACAQTHTQICRRDRDLGRKTFTAADGAGRQHRDVPTNTSCWKHPEAGIPSYTHRRHTARPPPTFTLPRDVRTTRSLEQRKPPTLTSLLPGGGSRQLAPQSQEAHQEEKAPGPHVSATGT